jgi:hypothetical protein
MNPLDQDNQIIEEALDAACRVIQAYCGQTAGDVAGQFFSGGLFGDDIRNILREYLRLEARELRRRTP